jgi:isopentenyl-diphosphate delta-isomerase
MPRRGRTKPSNKPINRRKGEHLRIVTDEDVVHKRGTLLDNIHLLHQALPELDLDEIDLSVDFFGRRLRAPLMITSMTGGAESALEINTALAQAAQEEGIAFSVGSQRIMLLHPELKEDFAVRRFMPDSVLLGNIGGVQLGEYPLDVLVSIMESIDADGICVHLNAAQELVQDEGNHNFRGILDQIARLVDRTGGRILVKETGAGMSPETLKKLASAGVSYVDVSGAGGTSWTKVEMYRAPEGRIRELGKAFAEWGVPTAFGIKAAREIFPDRARVVASGGILNGLDAARSIALGADVVGFARRILLSCLDGGFECAVSFVDGLKAELKTAMLLTGSRDVPSLQAAPRVYTGELRDWLATYGWL